MRVVNGIVAFIFLAGIAGVGCDNKTSGHERSFLSESVEKKRVQILLSPNSNNIICFNTRCYGRI